MGFWLFYYGYVSSFVLGDAVVHTLDVWLQSRLAWGKASKVNFSLGSEFVQLLQYPRLDVPSFV